MAPVVSWPAVWLPWRHAYGRHGQTCRSGLSGRRRRCARRRCADHHQGSPSLRPGVCQALQEKLVDTNLLGVWAFSESVAIRAACKGDPHCLVEDGKNHHQRHQRRIPNAEPVETSQTQTNASESAAATSEQPNSTAATTKVSCCNQRATKVKTTHIHIAA